MPAVELALLLKKSIERINRTGTAAKIRFETKLDQAVANNIFELPDCRVKKGRGRPAKYGKKSGTAKSLAAEFKDFATGCDVNLYGRIRTVVACERLVMLKTIKRDIGSAETQTRNPDGVTSHLHFCMMATSAAWIYARRMEKTPSRRHIVEGRNHFAFSDVRKSVAQAAADANFGMLFPVPRRSVLNSLVEVLLRMAA